MEENTFWLNIWRIVGGVVAVLILTIGGCDIHKQLKIADMVAAGADPIKAHCGVYGPGESRGAICAATVPSTK